MQPDQSRAERIQQTLQDLIHRFETGTVSEIMRLTLIPRHPADRRPSDKWSYSNRVLMVIQQTSDARGFKQWQDVGRTVKKGSRAIYIWGPRMRRVVSDEDSGESEPARYLAGFQPVAVFRVEDTDGEPVPVFSYDPPDPPPLATVAERFGLMVSYQADPKAAYRGVYSATERRIELLSHDSRTFWHELSHAAHHRVLEAKGADIKSRSIEEREAVAEVSACVLAGFYGQDLSGTSLSYLLNYIEPSKLTRTLMRVLDEVGETVAMILRHSEPT